MSFAAAAYIHVYFVHIYIYIFEKFYLLLQLLLLLLCEKALLLLLLCSLLTHLCVCLRVCAFVCVCVCVYVYVCVWRAAANFSHSRNFLYVCVCVCVCVVRRGKQWTDQLCGREVWCSSPHFTRLSHLHSWCRCCRNHQGDRVGLPDFTQWRWTQGVGLRPTLRRRCGPLAHCSKDSKIECGPSAPTELTMKPRWNTFF